VCTY